MEKSTENTDLEWKKLTGEHFVKRGIGRFLIVRKVNSLHIGYDHVGSGRARRLPYLDRSTKWFCNSHDLHVLLLTLTTITNSN